MGHGCEWQAWPRPRPSNVLLQYVRTSARAATGRRDAFRTARGHGSLDLKALLAAVHHHSLCVLSLSSSSRCQQRRQAGRVQRRTVVRVIDAPCPFPPWSFAPSFSARPANQWQWQWMMPLPPPPTGAILLAWPWHCHASKHPSLTQSTKAQRLQQSSQYFYLFIEDRITDYDDCY